MKKAIKRITASLLVAVTAFSAAALPASATYNDSGISHSLEKRTFRRIIIIINQGKTALTDR